ncbi:adenylyltransferase/cytidyltransferase family protein [Marinobacter sp. M216]|uniref:Adenylyltransferase/cytidyltransferase family protein n=1 Tax=Marinobacter albus TaxID=3030833 RepID=A0ABT7HB66_9GAMM|nr:MULTISPECIES: adenylyltransferase/cytidyltransferase family protein [unclassified Marinobacter]MBW7470470.1 adenylyltransferase/cytidyltransferase family protein [Marinobacter sp. F4218]MDK9557262.1 adenylyltransferase/cytidyltransferase family protein [Marinobacter sp. M216]
MKTVITYGTFDLFHSGHVKLLNRLRDLGDRLIVGCSTDSFNRIKDKRTVYPYEQRKEILEACRYVDKVFPENTWEQKREDILREGADIFAMGDDWAGYFDDLSEVVQVIYLPRTPDISSTDIKQLIGITNQERLKEALNLVQRLDKVVRKL